MSEVVNHCMSTIHVISKGRSLPSEGYVPHPRVEYGASQPIRPPPDIASSKRFRSVHGWFNRRYRSNDEILHSAVLV